MNGFGYNNLSIAKKYTDAKNHFKDVTEDGLYFTDTKGNVIVQITETGLNCVGNEPLLESLDIANTIENLGDNVSEIITLKDQLAELQHNVKNSVDSLATLKIETGGEITISVPGDLADLSNVVLRLALHYGSQEGDVSYDELFFNAGCNTDFSDIRFEDENGEFLDFSIESHGNYDFIKDSDSKQSWGAVLHLSDGTLVTIGGSGCTLSTDNGTTWTGVSIAGDAFFVDSNDNIYCNYQQKVRKLYASTGYTTYSEVLDLTMYDDSIVYTLGTAEDDDGYIYGFVPRECYGCSYICFSRWR